MKVSPIWALSFSLLTQSHVDDTDDGGRDGGGRDGGGRGKVCSF